MGPACLCSSSTLAWLCLDAYWPNACCPAGPVPTWLGKCFPDMEELDLSDNRVREQGATLLHLCLTRSESLKSSSFRESFLYVCMCAVAMYAREEKPSKRLLSTVLSNRSSKRLQLRIRATVSCAIHASCSTCQAGMLARTGTVPGRHKHQASNHFIAAMAECCATWCMVLSFQSRAVVGANRTGRGSSKRF